MLGTLIRLAAMVATLLAAWSCTSAEYGKGWEADSNLVKKTEMAAGSGDTAAQHRLGKLHEEGVGGKKRNLAAAMAWYEKAAAKGNLDAQADLGNLLRQQRDKRDRQRGLVLLEDAAQKGNANAQYYLGKQYAGLIVNDYPKALALFEKAAAQGHVGAMRELGQLYYQGNGTATDKEKGLQLLEQAADRDDVQAQYFTGLCYLGRDGTTADVVKARGWLNKACDNGYELACGLGRDIDTISAKPAGQPG